MGHAPWNQRTTREGFALVAAATRDETMPTWFALTVSDAAAERREVVGVFTALEEAEGARDEVLEEEPSLSKIVRVEAVEVDDL